VNLLKATVNGLQGLRRPEDVARIRGKAVHEILFPRKKDASEAAPTEEAAPAVTENAEADDHTDA